MNKVEILKIIRDLTFYKDGEFTPVEAADVIYINFGCVINTLEKEYNISKAFATLFDTTVVADYNDTIITVDKNTKKQDAIEQYTNAMQSGYLLYAEEVFNKAIKGLNRKNVMRKTKEARRLFKSPDWQQYISSYQINSLFKALKDVDKSTRPDEYLDGLVEEAKELKKIKIIEKRNI